MGQDITAMYIIGIMDYASHMRAKEMGTFEAWVDVQKTVENMWVVSLVKLPKVDLSKKDCHIQAPLHIPSIIL
jgi:hypothetical protein